MSKKVIARINSKQKVDLSSRSFCYFEVGDIITRDKKIPFNSPWCGKEVEVVGFTCNPDRLWGVVRKKATYEVEATYTDNLEGLSLLERDDWEFKVKDEVTAVINKETKEGKVIMIDPSGFYIVKFGNIEDGVMMSNEAFVPLRYRNKYLKNCLFCEEGYLAKRN